MKGQNDKNSNRAQKMHLSKMAKLWKTSPKLMEINAFGFTKERNFWEKVASLIVI